MAEENASPHPQQHAERVDAETIKLPEKTIYVDLKWNHRGYHFRITEETRGKRSAIVVPLEGAEDVANAMLRLIETARRLGDEKKS